MHLRRRPQNARFLDSAGLIPLSTGSGCDIFCFMAQVEKCHFMIARFDMGKAFDARVAHNGRLVLPKMVREALGMADGGTVVFSVEGGEIKLTSIRQSIKRAQGLYRQYATNDFTVDDFIVERRAEAAREDEA
jgi:AbrB family looped-hinge helix DNA binding protein